MYLRIFYILSAVMTLHCAYGQQPVIMLHGNGELSWTNACTNGTYTLQWSPDLSGAWRDWTSCSQVAPTGTSMTIDVPMYFRLMIDTNNNRFIPSEDDILMIIGQDTNSIDQYVAATGINPGGVMLYTSVQNAEGLTSPYADGGGTHYGQYLVDTYTQSVIQIGLYMVGALDNVLAGTYDSNIETLGNWMSATDRPVYLRIGYEFDADWTNYETGKYVQVYRYLVDRFRSNGVDNVAYVWHSQGYAVRHDPMAWYPGDGYVDWVAVSVFGNPYGTCKPYVDRIVEIARTLNKPLMIGEASPHGITATNGVDSWTAWYAPTLQFIRENDVKIFCYINCDWNAPEMWQFTSFNWGDARVQSDPEVFALWRYTATNSPFLHGSTNLFECLR
ncbi:MAG: hypothetical protein EOM20_20585 [Spartobacteria bacterium]|nr:hypothetical protein [Spartobacteria bacterium]